MASRRKRIIEAGLVRLAAITTANGFNTDAGAAVFLNEVPELGPGDPDVAIAMLTLEDSPRQTGFKVFLGLPIEIQAVVKVEAPDGQDEWHPALEAEDVLEDIKRAWELDDMQFGGLLNDDMERRPTTIAEREPGSTTVGLSIGYDLEYHEKWGAPEA